MFRAGVAGLEPAVTVLETVAFAAWRHPFDLPAAVRAGKGSYSVRREGSVVSIVATNTVTADRTLDQSEWLSRRQGA